MSDLCLLLVEDDAKAAALLVERFAHDGIAVTHAADGAAGLACASTGDFDVLIVDRMMPKLDGLSMVAKLRADGNTTPVLFLSALGEVEDRVDGLEAGGDDYLVKPYAYEELHARVTALARRKAGAPQGVQTVLQLADLTVDKVARTAARGGQTLELNPREFSLLAYLLDHQGQVVTRAMLLEHVWNYKADMQTNVVDVHVSRLRAKLDKGFEVALLHTVRGQGFVLRAEA